MSKYTSRFAGEGYRLADFATFSESTSFSERFVQKLRLKRVWYFPLIDFLGLSKLMGAYLIAYDKKLKVRDFLAPVDSVNRSDILILKGPMTKAMYDEILPLFKAMPEKKWVIYLGPKKLIPWAESGEFDISNSEISIDVYIPGGRLSSLAILEGIELLHERVNSGVCANA